MRFRHGSLEVDHQRQLDSELIVFVRSENVPEVRSLLKQGADPSARDLSMVPPESLLEHLVAFITRKHSPAFDQAPCALSYATSAAMRSDHPTLVRLLLDHGASVKLSEHWNRPPLILAASSGSIQTTRLFLDRGANANVVDGNGTTALRVGILSGSPEIVQLLLDHGAQVHMQKDANGLNDLDVANNAAQSQSPHAMRFRPIVTLLEKAGKAQGK